MVKIAEVNPKFCERCCVAWHSQGGCGAQYDNPEQICAMPESIAERMAWDKGVAYKKNGGKQ